MLIAASSMSSPLVPTLTLALCILAGIGTFLLLPRAKRNVSLRAIGGGLVAVAGVGFVVAMVMWAVANGAVNAAYIYFWIFAALAVAGAARVVTHPQPVYSAIYFVLTVFATAGLFVLLAAEFLAAALIIIYAGAILVVYVFVIMLASEASGEGMISKTVGKLEKVTDFDASSREPLLACIGGFTIMAVMLFVIFDRAPQLIAAKTPDQIPAAIEQATTNLGTPAGGIQRLGVYLFTQQAVAVQIAGLILTLAMVGAIIIARKHVLVVDLDGNIQPNADPSVGPMLDVDDNPHGVEVVGTQNPKQKEYPEL
jgi:NADH-quinone oxidoreductase subunit J